MIYLGYDIGEKIDIIDSYCRDNDINQIFLFSPNKFKISCNFEKSELIEYANIIMYKYYYRLLQEIDHGTLLVVNECLRTQNRNDLTYNCLRNFLNQTDHQIIFQNIPLIDTKEDFMILFDFDTKSRWKRTAFDRKLFHESNIIFNEKSIEFNIQKIETDEKTKESYQKKKRQLIDGIGLKDPHTIPRNLYLFPGKIRIGLVSDFFYYVGRNNRFKIEKLQTYSDTEFTSGKYTVFEFPHNFIRFSDFVTLSGQTKFDVLSTDLKVDDWYMERYQDWSKRINDAYTEIQQD